MSVSTRRNEKIYFRKWKELVGKDVPFLPDEYLIIGRRSQVLLVNFFKYLFISMVKDYSG